MQARIHTIHNEAGSITVNASIMQNVVVKTRHHRFENVNCIYYTVTNHRTGESASYAQIETMPNSLPKNVVPFMYETLERYTNRWFVSYFDLVDYIYYA